MRRWVVLGTLVVLAGVFAVPAHAASHTVNVVFPTFTPATVNINVGDAVVWHSTESPGGPNHTATGDSGEFNTGTIAPQGTSAPVTFNSAGTFTYHCSVHPQMTGSVFVQGDTSTTGQSTTTSRPASTTTSLKPTTTSSSLKPTTTSSSSSSSSTSTSEPDTTTSEESTTSTTDLVASGTTKHKGGAGPAAALIVLILAVAGAGGFAVYRLRTTR